MIECPLPDAGYRIGNSDRGGSADIHQIAAIIERILPDAGYGIGNGNSVETAAFTKRKLPDAGDLISRSTIGYIVGDNEVSCRFCITTPARRRRSDDLYEC